MFRLRVRLIRIGLTLLFPLPFAIQSRFNAYSNVKERLKYLRKGFPVPLDRRDLELTRATDQYGVAVNTQQPRCFEHRAK